MARVLPRPHQLGEGPASAPNRIQHAPVEEAVSSQNRVIEAVRGGLRALIRQFTVLRDGWVVIEASWALLVREQLHPKREGAVALGKRVRPGLVSRGRAAS